MIEITRRRFLTLSATGGAALMLAACSSGTLVMTTERATPVSSVSIAEAAEKLNAMRAARNLPLLTHNATLQKVAEEQARLMAENRNVAHTAAPEQTLHTRLRRMGFGGGAGENLAGGPPNLDTAIAGWLKSPSHNKTMVNPDYVQFGIAIERGPSTTYNTYGTYWALLLGVRSPAGRP
ncbi:CAP domain-containing protein [Pelagibacterium halotolerans]|uniref:Putative membrane protein n=1 Tax=Pelagibacterium halotolerans (strain DSM 22347 / JCM 15775 / CGMCC 1.7692 / B2) TaxID=1082931 RepID=G4RBQ9_PELHB|nr:CAP domain-containing protein [Pelagibacterium halotolerans]AEQ53700.1 putative membrane protein [Pelagibacterium halotolerans B2]QJR20732.1 CAP domain-containing protein [Pelagibacterium halotolerans]